MIQFTIQRSNFTENVEDFDEHDLLKHPEWNVRWFEEALSLIREEAPIDREEVVDWMHEAAAAEIELETFSDEYDEIVELSGEETLSSVGSRSGDGYIPGVAVDHWKFRKQKGDVVRRNGRGEIITYTRGGRRYRIGTLRVPIGGWAYKLGKAGNDITKHLRIVEGAVGSVGVVQYNAALVVFRRLAKVPIRRRVAAPRPFGICLPIHFYCHWRDVPFMRRVRIDLSVDRNCTIYIVWREFKDLSEHLRDGPINLRRGRHRLEYTIVRDPLQAYNNHLLITIEVHRPRYTKLVVNEIKYP